MHVFLWKDRLQFTDKSLFVVGSMLKYPYFITQDKIRVDALSNPSLSDLSEHHKNLRIIEV